MPSSTIQQNGDVSYVFVIRNGTAHMQDVKHRHFGIPETVVEGINPGDVMADSSFQKLQDKSKVVLSKTPIPRSTSGTNAP